MECYWETNDALSNDIKMPYASRPLPSKIGVICPLLKLQVFDLQGNGATLQQNYNKTLLSSHIAFSKIVKMS